MAFLVETECCGIRQLEGIQGNSAELNCAQAAEGWFGGDLDGAFIFFSAVRGYDEGKELTGYIRKNKLGKVFKTDALRNPNSGNMLTMWVWQVDKISFKRWWNNKNQNDDTNSL